MSDKQHASDSYDGVDFYINQYWKFVVPDLDREFADYESMKTAIENSVKKVVAAKKRKTSLAVVACGRNESGVTAYTINGVHSGHGHFLLDPKPSDRWSTPSEFFVDCTTVRTAFRMIGEHEAMIRKLNNVLKRYQVTQPGGDYRNRFSTDDHEGAVKRVESEHAKAMKRFETMTIGDEIRKASDKDEDE